MPIKARQSQQETSGHHSCTSPPISSLVAHHIHSHCIPFFALGRISSHPTNNAFHHVHLDRPHRRTRCDCGPGVHQTCCLHAAERARRPGSEREVPDVECQLPLQCGGERVRPRSLRAMRERPVCQFPVLGWIDMCCASSRELAGNEVAIGILWNIPAADCSAA